MGLLVLIRLVITSKVGTATFFATPILVAKTWARRNAFTDGQILKFDSDGKGQGCTGLIIRFVEKPFEKISFLFYNYNIITC